jgi:hypothetical protein
MTVEEGVGDIHLVHWPCLVCDNCEDDLNGRWLDDKGKGFIEVHTRSLREPVYHPTSLVLLEATIRTKLVFEHSLAGDHVGMRWLRDQLQGLVLL